MIRIGRGSPLRETTSAAYGVSGRLGGRRAPRGLPGKAFFATSLASGGLPGEESHARHVPLERGAHDFRGGRRHQLV
ncbi:MAG: hypothetical protein KAJ78_06190 [Acidobacteria bacterium]|nr:hypothetical protein [Acidobacteriota bacterium]